MDNLGQLVFSGLISSLLVLVSVAATSGDDDQTKTAGDEGEWVVQVEPGVKRYGRVPEFAEIGNSQSFDVSPEGSRIAFAAGDGIKLWDIKKKKVVKKLGSSAATLLEYSADGLSLYAAKWTAEGKSEVQIYDAITHELKSTIHPSQAAEKPGSGAGNSEATDEETEAELAPQPFYIQHLAVSPNDDYVAVGTGQKTLLFDTQTGEKTAEITHKNYSQSLAFLDDGKRLVDATGKFYDVETGQEDGELPGRIFGQHLQALRVNPKNGVVAASAWNKGVILYDLDKKKRTELEMPGGKAKYFYLIEFSGNGKLLASMTYPMNQFGDSSSQSEIYIWDAKNGKLKNRIELDTSNIQKLRFSANNEILYTQGGAQFGISSWKLDSKKQDKQMAGHTSPINQFQFSPKAGFVVATSQQGQCIVYDLKTGEPSDSVSLNNAVHLSLCKDGRYAVMGANYQNVTVYDLEKKKSKHVNIRSFSRPSLVSRLGGFLTRKSTNSTYENFAISNVCVADDDKHFLAVTRGQRNFRVEKFSLSAGKSVSQQRFKMKDYWEWDSNLDENHQANYKYMWHARTAAVSPNGQLVAIINDQETVFVIDGVDGELLHEFALESTSTPSPTPGVVHGFSQVKLDFTPDGLRLLVTHGNAIDIWDMETGEKTDGKLDLGGGASVYASALNRGGDRMVVFVQGHSPQVKVFDLDRGEEVFSKKLDEHSPGVGISDDGEKIAIAKPNCQFEVWDLNEVKKK